MRQTGLLFKYSPEDFVTGSSPLVFSDINPKGDWRPYLPSEERQSKDFTFDTMSCTTFSALSICETLINFHIEKGHIEKDLLKDYIDDNGKVNFSDRFTAVMSGTTKQGNYFQNVWSSIKKDGLLPEKDLPFGGNTWEEYHDKSKITSKMKAKALKILDLFDFGYEWVSFQPNTDLSGALKQSPIHGAIPFPAYHAVELPSANYIFDTYSPFLYERGVPVHYTMKALVLPKEQKPTYKYFTTKEVVGLKHGLVLLLDKAREIAGVPFVINSGYRTSQYNKEVGGVENSAHTLGLAVDLRCRNSTERFKIVKALMEAGFTRIGIGDTFVHCDLDKSKPQEVIWLY